MGSGSVVRAAANIVKRCDPVAVATYGGETGLLVIMESSCTSRAKRTEAVRDAMGRPGRKLALMVYTPAEVLEMRDSPECPLSSVLDDCEVVYGSLEGLASSSSADRRP